LSRAEFVRQFHAAYGLPPHAYLINLRLRKARRLLTRGLSLAQAAQESGFFDQSHLSRRFVRAYGVSPGTYARAARSYKTKASPAT
jgi:AraC-like DNA-binding protein